jgi:hypothetical protein
MKTTAVIAARTISTRALPDEFDARSPFFAR